MLAIDTATNRSLDYDTLVQNSQPELFRHEILFSIQTGGVAEEIAVDMAGSELRGSFTYLDYDSVGDDGTALTRKGNQTVVVTHHAPRQVRRVRVSSAALESGEKIGLHRIDVEQVVEEATVELPNNTTTNTGFVDGRFALRLSKESGLDVDDVFDLIVRSYPSSPRIGVAPGDPTRYDEALYFWQAGGEIGNDTPTAEGEVNAAAELSATLERLLNRELAAAREQNLPLPSQIDVALLIESSAPCRVEIGAFRVAFSVVTRSWLNRPAEVRAEKEVLRFTAGQVDTQTIPLGVLPGITIEDATIEVVMGRAGPAESVPVPSSSSLPNITESLFQKQGVWVDSAQPLALQINPIDALTVRSVALALMSHVPNTTLTLSLQSSWQDAPSGSPLAQGTLNLKRPGLAQWAVIDLHEPVIISTEPIWLVMQVNSGAVVWLAEEDENPGSVGQNQAAAAHQPPPIARIVQYPLLYQFISHQPINDTTESGASIGNPLAVNNGVRAGIGMATLPILTAAGDTIIYDLTDALNHGVDGLLAGGPAAGDLPLEFSGFGLKTLTVYPPYLELSVES